MYNYYIMSLYDNCRFKVVNTKSISFIEYVMIYNTQKICYTNIVIFDSNKINEVYEYSAYMYSVIVYK